MFDVIPKGFTVHANDSWIKQAEKNSFCRWVIYQLPDGDEFRALYNGLSHWVKVYRFHNDGTGIHLFDLTTQPEEDEETGEHRLPEVSEQTIREFLGWHIEEP
ncbi:MAG: hypothetical protein ABEK59_05190 [Halobacteria archaeon]